MKRNLLIIICMLLFAGVHAQSSNNLNKELAIEIGYKGSTKRAKQFAQKEEKLREIIRSYGIADSALIQTGSETAGWSLFRKSGHSFVSMHKTYTLHINETTDMNALMIALVGKVAEKVYVAEPKVVATAD